MTTKVIIQTVARNVQRSLDIRECLVGKDDVKF